MSAGSWYLAQNVTTESIDPQLRRNFPELIFQSITHIAPATNMVFTYPIIALKAGPDMPLSFLLATTICFFIGNTVVQFSRYMPSSGGYYSFATRGLGPRIGFMATWSYLVYELLGGARVLRLSRLPAVGYAAVRVRRQYSLVADRVCLPLP